MLSKWQDQHQKILIFFFQHQSVTRSGNIPPIAFCIMCYCIILFYKIFASVYAAYCINRCTLLFNDEREVMWLITCAI